MPDDAVREPRRPEGDGIDEAALVARVRRGDADAFDTLVSRHMRRAFAIAYRLLQQREDAEDLVQDAFLIALDRIDDCEPGRPFGPWFHRIVTNRALNARKARSIRRTEPVPDDVRSPAESPLRAAERSEMRDRLRDALDSLPDRQRTIVEMFELDGCSSTEIAEILEISAGTVRWHLHEARRTLRAVLAPYTRRSS